MEENQQGNSSTPVYFEKFTWKIENFTKQNTKNLRSKSFQLRGYKWRIHLHPLRRDVKHFSLYLMVADSLPAYGWSRNTHFKLVLINQFDSSKSVVKETQQKFNGGYRSWGSPFLYLIEFYDPKQGYLVNNTCIVEAHVCVSNIPFPLNNRINNSTSSNSSRSSDDQETEPSYESDNLSAETFGSSRTEGEELEGSDLTLKELIDLENLRAEEAAFVPLLEEACMWHPSLIRSQRNRSESFKLWAFTSLGQVLHFLKTSKVKDMNEDGCKRLRGLWEELVKASGFELKWLEPYVQSALDVRANLERTLKVHKAKEDLVNVEIKLKRLREELAAAEAEFEVLRKALIGARKGFVEIDLNAEIGYSMF